MSKRPRIRALSLSGGPRALPHSPLMSSGRARQQLPGGGSRGWVVGAVQRTRATHAFERQQNRGVSFLARV